MAIKLKIPRCVEIAAAREKHVKSVSISTCACDTCNVGHAVKRSWIRIAILSTMHSLF